MPIIVTDDKGNEVDLEEMDGGTLRKRYVDALNREKALNERLATAEAVRVIGEHGSKLVKPEDLVGVPVDEISAKVTELHTQRETERQEIIRSVLADRGLEGDDLDAAVKEFFTDTPAPEGAEMEQSWPSLETLGGTRPTRTGDLPSMEDPMGNLQAHFQDAPGKRK
jgi:predicted HAD superfamily phosphohydrolase